MRVGLAILNRNEEAALPVILPRLPRDAVDLCFAVDGGSTDRSLAIFAEHGVDVLPERSAGRGEAFRIAFAHARDRVDALVMFSADGNEDPADIARFRPFLEGGAEIVIASRFLPGSVNEEDGQRLPVRKWANQAFREAARRRWGLGQPRISDPINGFRAFTVAAWDKLALDGEGYTIEFQSSIRAYKRRLRVAEFPTAEGQRIGGESGARSIPTGLRFLRLLRDEHRAG